MIKNFLFLPLFFSFLCVYPDGLQSFDFSKFDTNRIELKLNTGLEVGLSGKNFEYCWKD